MPELNRQLWDMAGNDALETAQRLFGEQVGYLSPFQSLETVVEGQDCSVLRLCDRNFRIVCPNALNSLVEPLQKCVWVKRYDWLSAVALPVEKLRAITVIATVREPHRIEQLPNNQAVPVKFPVQSQCIPMLIWQHPINGKPAVELHISATDKQKLLAQLSSLST